MPDQTHGQLLRAARLAAGLTVEELSTKAKAAREAPARGLRVWGLMDWQLEVGAIRRFESGDLDYPSTFALRFFAAAPGINVVDLMTDERRDDTVACDVDGILRDEAAGFTGDNCQLRRARDHNGGGSHG